MNEQQKRQVRDNIVQAAKQSTNATLRNLIYIDMEQVDKIEAVSMVKTTWSVRTLFQIQKGGDYSYQKTIVLPL